MSETAHKPEFLIFYRIPTGMMGWEVTSSKNWFTKILVAN